MVKRRAVRFNDHVKSSNTHTFNNCVYMMMLGVLYSDGRSPFFRECFMHAINTHVFRQLQPNKNIYVRNSSSTKSVQAIERLSAISNRVFEITHLVYYMHREN